MSICEPNLHVGIHELDKPASISRNLDNRYISNLMYMIWLSRKDLQHAFDLNTEHGQRAFVHWYDVSVLREYGIPPEISSGTTTLGNDNFVGLDALSSKRPLHTRLMRLEGTIGRIGRYLPSPVRKIGKSLWFHMLGLAARVAANGTVEHQCNMNCNFSMPTAHSGLAGANLVGYVHAELGMGEHVRMSAAAFDTTNVNFCVLNYTVGVSSRQQATLEYGKLSVRNTYNANIFHINADQMLLAYCHLGREFFSNRYNIGYWAWELSLCPNEWIPVIGMVDEIWAPSRFIQKAFADCTKKPVEYMPLCVSLPPVPKFSRSHYGLPINSFLFLFTFDFFSYIDRKNPFAIIRAFKKAFPHKSKRVGLVIKVMNGDSENAQWIRMLELIDNDPRIYVLNKTMSRTEVLGLFEVCDCFVSLHRSEGFGRGPAEAMYLGKPVIVTNYSGNVDFTLQNNSCLVDYQLIPVEEGQYVFSNGQVWADPDITHAAWYMRKLVDNTAFSNEIGLKGKECIYSKFSPAAIGAIYEKRLREIRVT